MEGQLSISKATFEWGWHSPSALEWRLLQEEVLRGGLGGGKGDAQIVIIDGHSS